MHARIDPTYRLSFAIVGDEADVRDATQETFVAADIGSMTLGNGPRRPCAMSFVSHEVVLEFSGPVDAPAIKLYRSATIIN